MLERHDKAGRGHPFSIMGTEAKNISLKKRNMTQRHQRSRAKTPYGHRDGKEILVLILHEKSD